MAGPRTEHSWIGIASFVLAFFPAVLLVGADQLVMTALSRQPSGANEAGYTFGMFLLLLLTIASELTALGLGVVGAFQRWRGRSWALVGTTWTFHQANQEVCHVHGPYLGLDHHQYQDAAR